jgi:hypothetical protein
MFEKLSCYVYFGFCLDVSADIVAVSEIAAHHHKAVKSFFKGSGHRGRIDPAGAHNSNGLDFRGIL